MAEKILYILGAGASVNALPLARSVWKEDSDYSGEPKIRGLAYDLANFDWTMIPGSLTQEDSDIINVLDRAFQDLALKADEFGDVDTYAKYLNLMAPSGLQLTQLKKTLAIYFTVKQRLMNLLDRRYVPWLVSIMNSRLFQRM